MYANITDVSNLYSAGKFSVFIDRHQFEESLMVFKNRGMSGKENIDT
tara:strand:+ start:435 stop:575 length:141 start_codon:yes stop_codon:yes gene_type:complete